MQKINSLDTKYKDLIELIYLQGYTQQEVSDEFKIPLGTIKTRISTAIKLLRNALNLLIIFIIAR
jgi:RNA polymerase sigma-70 factor (ECF subfamily)